MGSLCRHFYKVLKALVAVANIIMSRKDRRPTHVQCLTKRRANKRLERGAERIDSHQTT